MCRPLRSWLFISFLALFAGLAWAEDKTGTPADKEDAEQDKILWEGRRLIDSGKSSEAITRCFDKVLAHYEAKYRGSKKQIYCAQNPTESLAYLLTAASENREAVVLSGTWSDAHFMKGFALSNLKRASEAKASIQRAIKLSPMNAQYHNELGYCFQVEKNWQQAAKEFREAEEHARAIPAHEEQVRERTRALRGEGYVLVELGKFHEAEKKYLQCLELNPNDDSAKNELVYVRARLNKAPK
jgi:tetratricopeptide (TPR) repeat protein